MMKQILLTTILCLSMAISGFAQRSGVLTETMTWYLDAAGTLTISGIGAMPDNYCYYDYDDYGNEVLRYWSEDPIQQVIISEGVTSIGEQAFNWCTSLTSISIPEGVTSIGNYAFYGCSSLTSIIIPDGVINIESSAFNDCSSLTSITIPGSVTRIGDGAFYGCTGLISVSITDGVSIIEEQAFRFCESLTSITIPSSVTSIGNSAFGGCDALKTLNYNAKNCNLENESTPIGWTSIETLIIGENVESISASFASCEYLVSVTIPSSVINIGNSIFAGCIGLTSFDVNSENNNYKSVNGILFNKAMTTIIQCPAKKEGAYTIPSSVTNIEDRAFLYCNSLTSITIPNGVTSIGVYAFHGCSGLTSITIPNLTGTIGSMLLNDCTNLTKITCYIQNWIHLFDSFDLFGDINITNCDLYVPASVVDAYKAVERWKGFNNIFAIPSVVIEEPEPVKENGKGSFDFSLEIPGNASITGSFNIQLPEGYTLDEATTLLSETLAELFELIITAAGNNSWRIEIVSNGGLRASHDLPEYTRIMSIGYIVNESVSNGNYEIELKDIDMQLEDGTPIEQETITVATEVRREGTSLSSATASPVRVYPTEGNIVVENAPVGEIIHIYNVSGTLVAKTTETIIALPQGMYIVKVGKATFKVTSNE